MTLLDKAFSILDIFLCFDDCDIRLSDLACLSELHIATVSRIVSKLVDYGYLSQAEKRGKYMLGAKFLEFASFIEKANLIKRISMPHLIELYKLIDETVGILKWNGEKLTFIHEIRTTRLPRISTNLQEGVPKYCSAAGKIILAGMTDYELGTFLSNKNMQAYTKESVIDFHEFKRHLGEIVQEGIAYDDEECWPGFRNVASRISNIQGRTIACINVLGPSDRMTWEKMREITPYIKECATEISKKLKYIKKGE